MAETTNSTSDTKTFEDAATRVRELNERIIDSTKKFGNVSLDGYESALKAIADFQEKVASASSVEWVSTIAQAQADFTREITKTYTTAARTLLK
jgi:hypothetical protein